MNWNLICLTAFGMVAERAIDFYIEQPEAISLLVRTANIPDEELARDVTKDIR